ncbi:MAG: hypothetical protein WBM17_12305, partial [Anaerolineales bacterium]
MKIPKILGVSLSIGMLFIGGACILEAVAPASTPQVIVVTETPGGAVQGSTGESGGQLTPTFTQELTQILTATFTPSFTATFTVAPVTMTAGQSLSCVTGPHWILYEWVAGIAEGEVVTLLAKAPPEWEEYYYVRKSDGKECWAFGGSSTKSGDPSSLPVREAPPLPEITYTIENQTHLTISSVRMRQKDETVWGTNLVGGSPILAQQSFHTKFTAGFYDVRIMDDHSGILYEAQDIPIGGESSSNHRILDNQISFTIFNNYTLSVCRTKVTHTASGYTKELPIPGDGRLVPGETLTFTSLAGIYQLQLYRCVSNALIYTFNSAYIGPLTTGFTYP